MSLVTLAMGSHAALAGDRTVIWETREGYVAVVPKDPIKNVRSPNNQPIELADDLLIGLLGSIKVRDTSKDKPVPLLLKAR